MGTLSSPLSRCNLGKSFYDTNSERPPRSIFHPGEPTSVPIRNESVGEKSLTFGVIVRIFDTYFSP